MFSESVIKYYYYYYPAEGYGIKYEGNFLGRSWGEKSESRCFQKCYHFLSPPLLGIIYIGLNPKCVDVILVDSFMINGSFKLKFTQPRACVCYVNTRNENWRQITLTSWRHYASIARELRDHCASIAVSSVCLLARANFCHWLVRSWKTYMTHSIMLTYAS